MIISLIVAMSLNRVIGNANKLPWHLPADLQEFKKNTLNRHIVMGRHTFNAIGGLLPNRISIVVSTTMDTSVLGYYVVRNLSQAINFAKEQGESELFIIGGQQIYTYALPLAHRIYLTKIHTTIGGDTYFPLLGKEWIERKVRSCKADIKNVYDYDFILLERECTQ